MSVLDFSKEYILENNYVRLSPIKYEHIESLIEISNDLAIWKYFFEKGNTLEDITKYVQTAIKNREARKEYPFVVYDKIKEHYAGCTRLYEYSKELNIIKL